MDITTKMVEKILDGLVKPEFPIIYDFEIVKLEGSVKNRFRINVILKEQPMPGSTGGLQIEDSIRTSLKYIGVESAYIEFYVVVDD